MHHLFIFIASLLVIFIIPILKMPGILKRLSSLLSVILGTTLIVSLSLHMLPGDPVDHILGDQATKSSRELLRKDLGLIDEHGKEVSLIKSYTNFLSSLINNDIKSYVTRRNTLDMVLERFPYTIALSIFAMLFAIIIGPFMGIIASLNKNKWPDHLLSVGALVGISIPSFFLGPLLLLLFSIHFSLLPISGADEGIRSLILPGISLGTALSAMLARMMRASMLEVLSEDYIKTAHSKGLSRQKVFFKHALRNALIPITTIIGLQFGAVLTGAVVTEKIFNWPGIGLLLFEGISKLDIPLVQTCVVFIAFLYALINMLTDMAYSIIDPRISIDEAINESH